MNDKDSLIYHFSKFVSELENRIAQRVLSELTAHSGLLGGVQPSEERLLKADELCELLHISTSHLYNLRKKFPDFPIQYFGGSPRYKLSEVEEFIKVQPLKKKK
ncbi:helix-turn-helix domain-containing protein [Chryseobacterium camelliae]|uniref:Helix-turn-helix domain-containing protein n=1 Tax=Chryseobacterium camelliae TaxID=1265445 RepID=A0ABY7QJK9_9FLAO|nr:helix-turn-helix domain-containing protein [Chryseobacterium camelliae]WBV59881.1 helix-turn-helix domain-containing protein [Chryseobacterium camelliae]